MARILNRIANPKRRSNVLIAAGIYNILWGLYSVFFPQHIFQVLDLPTPNIIELWQCIGMMVGVYGVGYLIAAFNPIKHWPIIFVGLLGKVFGPIGFLISVGQGKFPFSFGIINITNDLIWIIPFSLILLQCYRKNTAAKNNLISCFDLDALDKMETRFRAKFINSLTGWKTAYLLGTVSSQGQTNLSVVSSVFHLGSDPALVGLIIRPDVTVRHSLENLRETKVGTLNHIPQGLILQAHQTSARYPKEQSEFQKAGLTELHRYQFKAPFVQEASIQMGVELIQEEKIEHNGTHFLILKINQIHVPQGLISDDGHINLTPSESTSVLGLDCYGESLELGRVNYAKVDYPSYWTE